MNAERRFIAPVAKCIAVSLSVLALCLMTGRASADVVTDWNKRSIAFVVAAKKSPGFGQFTLAMTNTAVYTAVNAITQKYPRGFVVVEAPDGASVEAAVATATRQTLVKFLPEQSAKIDHAYKSALEKIADNHARKHGIAVGESATAAVFAYHKSLGKPAVMNYRPATTPGVYVPTPPLAGVAGGEVKVAMRPTWILSVPAALSPPPPVALDSEIWIRDYNEVKSLGHKDSSARSKDQTQIALFWEDTQPPIFYSMLLSLANQPGRELTRNARLLAAAGLAMHDAITAVFEAKYRYQFWRPMTAIRNGDKDPSEATERDSAWAPLIKTPMHPEYPCAHCIVSASAASVALSDLGDEPSPVLQATSLKLPGVTRNFNNPDAFAKEVIEARIYDGVHYRNSGEIGYAMGMRLGKMAMEKFPER